MKLAAALLTLFFALPAQAIIKVAAVGSVNSSEAKTAGTVYEPKPALGYGVLVDVATSPIFSMELGAIYSGRKYENKVYNASHTELTTKLKMLHFPVLFRAHLGSFMSLGVGGYANKYHGEIERTPSTNGAPGSPQYFSYAALNRAGFDYGFLTSVALYFNFAPGIGFVLDGRYALGVKDNDLGVGSLKYNDIQALAGVRIGL